TELFEALGIAQPKGVLLYGPPGTGKTLLARAVAHHTECTFIRVSGSELVQKFIGEGARMVRRIVVSWLGSTRLHLYSWTRLTRLAPLGLEGGSGSDSVRLSWQPTGSTSWTAPCFRPGRIDRKFEFPARLAREPGRTFCASIRAKMNLTRASICQRIAEVNARSVWRQKLKASAARPHVAP
uniref:ATPase_AAA_core domain-containing protein n=1 Tax=Macrostomum lignano TaxID=282301 RepID=A0A1I8FGV5_9PLAT